METLTIFEQGATTFMNKRKYILKHTGALKQKFEEKSL